MNLTTSHYWDQAHSRDKGLTGKFGLERFAAGNCRFRHLFRKRFRTGNKTILEVGCAPGGWLVYFNQAFGYSVYGIDYSEIGCRMTEEKFRHKAVSGNVICGDFLDSSFQNEYEGFFDVVYSLGLIEHFSDATEVLRAHARLLKSNGTLLISMPNYGNGTISRRFMGKLEEEAILSSHNVELMKIEKLKSCLSEIKDIEIESIGYVGPVSLGLSRKWKLLGRFLDLAIGYLTFFLRSERFSSSVIIIGRKI